MIRDLGNYRESVIEAHRLEQAGVGAVRSQRGFQLMLDLAEFELKFMSTQGRRPAADPSPDRQEPQNARRLVSLASQVFSQDVRDR